MDQMAGPDTYRCNRHTSAAAPVFVRDALRWEDCSQLDGQIHCIMRNRDKGISAHFSSRQ